MLEILYTVSLYMGILGFLAFTFSYLSGMRIIKVKAKYKLHKRIGILGFTAMCIHGLVMCYFHYFS
jgi:hypothetical protein